MNIRSANSGFDCPAIGSKGLVLRRRRRSDGALASRSFPVIAIFVLIACAFTSVVGLSVNLQRPDSRPSPLANDWTNMVPGPPTPSARWSHTLAYDDYHDLVIMFGGFDTGYNAETWSYNFNGNSWSNLIPSGGMPGRMDHAMVWDSADHRIIVFGGISASTGMNSETWEYTYETNKWLLMNNGQLSPRGSMAMAYDNNRNKVYLHGGYGGGSGDTWSFNYGTNTWSNLNPLPPPNPSSRYGHAMAYDSESDQVILFGGNDGSLRNDTWAYSPAFNMWTQMNPSTKPPVRYYHSMVYDSVIDRIIMLGGSFSTGYWDDVWTYDYNTNTWEKREPSSKPSARWYHSRAYDSESDRVIMFGGWDSTGYSGETWSYELSPPDVPFLPSGMAVMAAIPVMGYMILRRRL